MEILRDTWKTMSDHSITLRMVRYSADKFGLPTKELKLVKAIQEGLL